MDILQGVFYGVVIAYVLSPIVNLTEQKTIPVDRKIIFLYPGDNLESKIYISVSEKKFTWPKNWTWAGLYKNVPGNYDIRMFEAAVKYFK